MTRTCLSRKDRDTLRDALHRAKTSDDWDVACHILEGAVENLLAEANVDVFDSE